MGEVKERAPKGKQVMSVLKEIMKGSKRMGVKKGIRSRIVLLHTSYVSDKDKECSMQVEKRYISEVHVVS